MGRFRSPGRRKDLPPIDLPPIEDAGGDNVPGEPEKPGSEPGTSGSEPGAPGFPRDPELHAWVAERVEVLDARRVGLKDRRSRRLIIGVVLVAVGCLATVGMVILYVTLDKETRPLTIPIVLYGLLVTALGGFMLSSAGEVTVDIQNIDDEKDLVDFERQPVDLFAYKLFRLNQLQVKRHQSQTLSQGRIIFLFGLFCILLGFVIIAYSLKQVSGSEEADTSAKLITGGVGAVAGILTNFVAYIFLRMFQETSKRLTAQQDRLVTTHYLHFGNYLAARISGDDALRNETLSSMAKSLAGSCKSGREPAEAEPPADELKTPRPHPAPPGPPGDGG
ncbi:TRADD-N-associated membrane domain-containing protein [Streptomyces albireticuli]|uniref:Cyanobacterial TRADD-N associated 2 transmembrane domain-containing protein n=1 Tax=Streptomyces albireticuli TaxID=1940 RepID=A0A2A2D1M8_9ACTN|nr:hypothetical protein [Streptomyces albireticuli]MCD9195046.1 hypothetical protein [Streptomyces albireticuli]PAU46343.1 hypothetical protein CK936_24635 [Streptomyces albireticuli]